LKDEHMLTRKLHCPARALLALLPALLAIGTLTEAHPAAANAAPRRATPALRTVVPRTPAPQRIRAGLRSPAPARTATVFTWGVDGPRVSRTTLSTLSSVALWGCWSPAQVARAAARTAAGTSLTVAVARHGGTVTVAGRRGAAVTLPMTISITFTARLRSSSTGTRMTVRTSARRGVSTLTVGGPLCAAAHERSSARAVAAGRSAPSARALATTTALAIDSGGTAAAPFVADTDYHRGRAHTSPHAIATTGVANLAPRAVYQSERYGHSFSYVVPRLTPGASYTVRLHFAEIYWTAPGKRVFNVAINGARVLSDFDIYAAAGGAYRAIVKPFAAHATAGGTISVAYTTVVDNAKSSGIEILSSTPAATLTAATRTTTATATRAGAATSTPSPMATATATATPAPAATVPPAAVPAATRMPTTAPAAMSTPVPASTATATAMSTPTATSAAPGVATLTPTGTAAPTATATAIATDVAPTATATGMATPPSPTMTATAGPPTTTATAGPPTATPSAATTGVATAIPSTATGVPATATATPQAPVAISSDPFTSPAPGQHASEVEPDTFAYGDTEVSAFQVGRFNDGGGASIGWATRRNGVWQHGLLPGVTTYDTPAGPYDRASDPSEWGMPTLSRYVARRSWTAAFLRTSIQASISS